jgi:hypothetical protein
VHQLTGRIDQPDSDFGAADVEGQGQHVATTVTLTACE